MKLSTRARYGLRALIDLGLYSDTEAVSIQSIAGRQNISVSYLEQLMGKLKRAGLVESTRGACGGYRLGRPAAEISVGDILRVLEGSLEAAQCPGTEGDHNCETGYLRGEICMEEDQRQYHAGSRHHDAESVDRRKPEETGRKKINLL